MAKNKDKKKKKQPDKGRSVSAKPGAQAQTPVGSKKGSSAL